jgi:hypothetical protein
MPSSKRSASSVGPSAALSAAPSRHVPHHHQSISAILKSSHPARELCLIHAHLYGLQTNAGDLRTQRPPPILLHHANSPCHRPFTGAPTQPTRAAAGSRFRRACPRSDGQNGLSALPASSSARPRLPSSPVSRIWSLSLPLHLGRHGSPISI